MTNTAFENEYNSLCDAWFNLNQTERQLQLETFKVLYSYNSGNIENEEITYHDTAEIFDDNGVSNFTGDVRTIYEINNLKNAWLWLERKLKSQHRVDEQFILAAHRVLTQGTYDEDRWAKGERPGTFKKNDYRVADDVGASPLEVPALIEDLIHEIDDAFKQSDSHINTLTIAAYFHVRLVDIHPFADGNGRTARLLMNYILMRMEKPPISIDTNDRLAYFGALDVFHYEGNLNPFIDFLETEALKTWGKLIA